MTLAILDIKGKVLVAIGWQDICTRYHRIHPDTARNCSESDLFLTQNVRQGEFVAYRCKNQMWDVVTPLYVGGKHIGNIFTGQFFYDDEIINEKVFIAQAARYGFDREAYLHALHCVPRFSRDRVNTIMSYLVNLSVLVSKLSYRNLELARSIARQQQMANALRENENLLRATFNATADGILVVDKEGRVIQFNAQFADMWRIPRELLSTGDDEKIMGFVLDQLEDPAVFQDQVRKLYQTSSESLDEIRFKDGRVFERFSCPVISEGYEVGRIWDFRDITERKQAVETIRTEQLFTQALLDSLPGIFYLYTYPELRLVRWNKNHETLLGFGPGEIDNRSIMEWHVPQAREAVRLAIETAMEKGQNVIESPLLAKDGHLVPFLMTGVKFESLGNSYLMGVGIDITERKKMERSLVESETRLRTLLQTIPDLIWLKDADGVYLSCNRMFERFFGAGEADIVGKTDYDFVGKTLADFFRAHDRKAIEAGKPCSNEEWLTFREGGYHGLFDTIKTPMYDDEGKLIGVLGISHDITKSRLSEKLLSESEERYRLITDNITDIILTTDISGAYTFISPSHKRVLARGEEVLGRSIFEHIHPEDLPGTIAIFDKAMHSGDIARAEYRYSHPSRGYIWLESEGMLVNIQGTLSAIIVSRDITSRKQAEESLRESEERFRQLFESMVSGFALHEVICDEQGAPKDYRFLKVNPAFEELTGLKGEAVIGRTVREIMPDIESSWIDTFGRVALTGTPVHFENFSRTLNKSFEVSAYSPRPGQFAAVFLDITERKRTEEERQRLQVQLSQAQKMESIGTLAGGIAHDFNNILSSVLGFTELAKLKAEKGKDIINELDVVMKAGIRARDLVKQILMFSRQAEIKRMPMDIAPLIKETLKFLRASLPATIEFRQDIAVSESLVMADPVQIHQILMNLCTNAAHAMKEKGGLINLRLHEMEITDQTELDSKGLKRGRYLLLSVSDTGCGIPGEIINRIFDPFFTTKERGEGTGMGLSVVHGIVKDMEGAISVYSEPGRGTTFNILIPRCDGARVEATDLNSPMKTGSARILFVDDEEGVIVSGRGILEQLGYQITATTSPQEALALFTSAPDRFDLVLTDMTMPGMTGLTLSERLRKIRPDIPIVLSTGFSLGISQERIRDAGIREMVMKPMVASELSGAVYRALIPIGVNSGEDPEEP
ncbi:MAG TPA: PAS domain S-box protein, partial [Smithellaceae bacterium]|nr:PAS domain S-box protein [Smithellaceae bacterium]